MHEQFTDPFASHVYQAVLYTLNGQATKNLTGVPEEPKVKKRRVQLKAEDILQTPPSFSTLRQRLFDIVKSWEISRFHTLAFDKYAVPLLQTIVESDIPIKEKKEKKSKSKKRDTTLANLLLFGNGDESCPFKVSDLQCSDHEKIVNRLLRDTVGSRIIETIIRVSSNEIIQYVWDTYFKDEEKLSELCEHPAGNFTVQRMFERMTNPDDISSAIKFLLLGAMDLICTAPFSHLLTLRYLENICCNFPVGCECSNQHRMPRSAYCISYL